MKILKILAVAGGSAVALLLLGMLALLLLVKPDEYRGEIARLVERETGRHLAIDGELGLRFFPWLSLEVSRVSLGNPPGFGSEPFVAARTMRVGVRILPLLSKRLEVSRILVDGLEANLVAHPDGHGNWENFGRSSSSATSGADGSGGASPGSTSIGGIDLTDATVRYRNEATGSVTRVQGIALHAGQLGTATPVPVTLKLALDAGEGTPATRLALAVKLGMDGDRVTLTDLALDGEHSPAPAPTPAGEPAAKPLTFAVRTAMLAIDRKAGTLAPARLDLRVGELALGASIAGQELFGDRVLSGELQIPEADLRKLGASFGFSLPKARDAAAFGRFAGSGGYRLTSKALQLSSLDLRLDDTRVRGRAGITDLDTLAIVFDLDIDQIDADRYLPPAGAASAPTPGVATSGGVAAGGAKAPTPLPLAPLRKLVAKGELRIGRAKFNGLQFTAVRLPLDADHGDVRLGPTAAQMFGGSYAGNIALDARATPARLSLDEHLRGIDLGALVKGAFKSERFSGRGDADAKLGASGDTDAAMFRSVAGRVDVNVRDGALVGRDLWYEIRRARALFRGELPPPKSGPDQTAFRALSGSATIAAGVARNDDLKLDLTYLRAKGAGTFALATQAIDYRLTAEVYDIPPEGSAGAEMADLKSLEIPLTITGTLSDYKVRPDFAGLVKAKLQQKVDEKKQELKSKLQDQLKGKLKGIFN